MPVILDSLYGQFCLRVVEKPEALVRVFGKVDHPPVCKGTHGDGDESLHDEHPLPTFQAGPTVQLVQAVVQDVPRGQSQHLRRLEESVAQLLLSPGVPRADQIGQAGIYPGHGNTQDNAEPDHLLPVLNKRRAQGNQSKAHRDDGKPDARSHETDGKRRGKLE